MAPSVQLECQASLPLLEMPHQFSLCNTPYFRVVFHYVFFITFTAQHSASDQQITFILLRSSRAAVFTLCCLGPRGSAGLFLELLESREGSQVGEALSLHFISAIAALLQSDSSVVFHIRLCWEKAYVAMRKRKKKYCGYSSHPNELSLIICVCATASGSFSNPFCLTQWKHPIAFVYLDWRDKA